MQLNALFTKVKLDYLPAQLDTPCERAAKRDLTHQGFLAEASHAEGRGAIRRGSGVAWPRPGSRGSRRSIGLDASSVPALQTPQGPKKAPRKNAPPPASCAPCWPPLCFPGRRIHIHEALPQAACLPRGSGAWGLVEDRVRPLGSPRPCMLEQCRYPWLPPQSPRLAGPTAA